jgi:TolB-like protein/Tfp pilus assembly protein PilF
VPKLFVIDRSSSFTYKDKPVKIQQVSEELGVQYVLEGSVLKSDDKIRITAQLIDALTGGHIWSDRYDRSLNNFFTILDEITLAIVVELQVKLTEGDPAQIYYGSTRNFEAWGYVTRGMGIFLSFTKEAMNKSRELFKKALNLDPNYAHAMTSLAWTHFMDARYGYSESMEASLKRSFELAKKSSAMDDNQPMLHSLFQFIYLIQKQYDKSIEEGRKAVSLGPNDAQAHAIHCDTLYRTGLFEESVRMCEKSMRLQPHASLYYLNNMSTAYFWVERYEESLAFAEKLISQSRKTGEKFLESWGYWHSALAKIKLGRELEARKDIERYLEIRPDANLESDRRNTLYKPEIIKREHEVIRQIGFPEHPPLPLPDKPSIAVLAFDNMSGDPKQEYFSDGISENIITALSKVGELFVIARNSSFTYKDKPVKVQQISRELGIRYVLEGSVRMSGNRVRTTAQLIDAKNGQHLWAETYDRNLEDIFEIQDEITMEILTALQVELTEGEKAHVYASSTKNLKAYLKYLEGGKIYKKDFTKEYNAMARQRYQEAIAIDPQFARAYEMLGRTHSFDARYGWSESRSASMKQALELAQKAIDMDENHIIGRILLSYIYRQKRQYEKSIAEMEIVINHEPNNASAYAWLAVPLYTIGKGEEGVAAVKKAIRLNPIPEDYYFYLLGNSHLVIEQYNEAIAAYKKFLDIKPSTVALVPLTVCYIFLGREEEAHASALEILRLEPDFSVDRIAKRLAFKDKVFTDRYVSALRKAGLK